MRFPRATTAPHGPPRASTSSLSSTTSPPAARATADRKSKRRSREMNAAKGFPFKYLHDESQEVARAYGAVCTPDFFGYNADLELQYRGRLDASKTTLVPDARRELYEAMLYEEARRGYLVTTGNFSPPAIEWARLRSIQLVSGAELATWVTEAQPNNVSP